MIKWSGSKIAIAAALFLLIAPLAFSQSGKKLEVKVSYQGAGEVTTASGIHLYLFDTPNISEGSMPIGMTSVYENGATATFSIFSSDPVYLVGAYGSYDPTSGPPPSGTPVAAYRPGEPGGPTPITIDGDTTRIEFSFGDDFRMP